MSFPKPNFKFPLELLQSRTHDKKPGHGNGIPISEITALITRINDFHN
jgi:hypothetical protein